MPESPSPDRVAMELREDDILRQTENRRRYESFYDAWADESPSAINEQFSAELRERLRGGNSQD